MSTPTTSMLHLSQPLTNISVAFNQDSDNFVANKVFPVVPVEKEYDKYYIYDRAAFIKNKMQKRANGTESQGDGFTLSNDSYSCDTWALHKDVTDRDRANQDSPLNMDRDVTIFLSQQGLISAEINWAAEFFTTSVWGTDVAGVASSPTGSQYLRWDNSASTPFIDVASGMSQVTLASGGFEPNTLVLGYQVFTKLKNHPEIIDRVKSVVASNGTPNSMITINPNDLAQAFGLARVLVMKGVYNSANEGASAASNAFIGGKHALLCYSAPMPGILQPSAGYTFAWRGMGHNEAGVAMSKFRMEHLKADRIEIEAAYDFKKVGSELGYFFQNAVS